MYSLTSLALLLVAGYVLYQLISRYMAYRYFVKFAAENGCQPAVDCNPTWVPLNLDILKRVMKDTKAGKDIIDTIFIPFWEKLGYSVGVFEWGLGEAVLTAEPANIQTVLATNFRDYGLGFIRKKAFGIALGSGIFSSDGPAWEHSRALFRPQFAKDLINDLDFTEEATRTLFKAMGDTEPGQWTRSLDMLPLLFRFTLDTSTEFLFGQSTNSQMLSMTGSDEEKRKATEFTDAFQEVQEKMILRINAGLFFWLIDGPKLRRAIRTIRGFVEPLVQQAMSIRSQDTAKVAGKDEKGQFSMIRALAKSNIDQVELRDQLIALLAAGRDTTSTLLSWTFLLLSLHPTVFTKLRQSIIEDIGPDHASQQLDFSKLKSCKYLQYVLNETLRLFPSVPINNRVANTYTILPTGGGPDGKSPIALRPGSYVTYCVYAMHRRKDLWGEDAMEFKPERWTGRKHDWSYLPFNGGPRVCLGQQYALTEASYLTARLLQHFDTIEPVKLGDLPEPVGLVDGLWGMPKTDGLTKPPVGVTVRLRRAAGV